MKDHNFESIGIICGTYHIVIVPFSEQRGYEHYDTWKAWEILRQENGIGGKHGKYQIVSYEPIVDAQVSIASVEEQR
jgi:hypothetical protein